MSVTVTNVEHYPDGSPWMYGKVTVALAGAAFDANGAQIIGAAAVQTDGAGAASFPGLITGQTYVWTSPDRTQTYFTPTVADGGTQSLASCSGPFVPAGTAGVTQAQLAAQLGTLAARSTVADVVTA